ncbi:hypothetical protein [Bradyrhizobium japonicum]|uniref:hypothetical protein n=1 Tax=Bradyrhizobium japonicum TaxID=375 RepID=UPI000462E612|nr:hypothetical protein [Bradyrhizobium japonicum]
MLTMQEKVELRYLGRSRKPLWGGHLERGEPLSDQTMQRWLSLGLIQQVGKEGYVLTPKGEQQANAGSVR